MVFLTSLCFSDASHQVSVQSDIWLWRCGLKITQPSWTLDCNNFSNSGFPCSPDASNQVLLQSDILPGRFQDGGHLGN